MAANKKTNAEWVGSNNQSVQLSCHASDYWSYTLILGLQIQNSLKKCEDVWKEIRFFSFFTVEENWGWGLHKKEGLHGADDWIIKVFKVYTFSFESRL